MKNKKIGSTSDFASINLTENDKRFLELHAKLNICKERYEQWMKNTLPVNVFGKMRKS